MSTKLKRLIAGFIAVLALATTGSLVACSSDADVASSNLSKAADNFEIQRRIVFVNGITDKYLMVIEGLCSLGNSDKAGELSVTCKVSDKNGGEYKKHFLGLSDNVTYFVEQIDAAHVDPYHYRVVFKPEEIVPDIDFRHE